VALSDEIDAYQTYLEAVRAHPDDEELWEDLAKAKAAVEVAYLEQLTAGDGKPALAEERHGANSRPAFDPEIGWTTSDDAGVW
jgi:hypothetical protein